MQTHSTQTSDPRDALDRFLADNPELEQLSARLARFNAFRVLRVENAEIRHSNVLAWLLDPMGSHGLGRTVLRRLLSSILLAADAPVDGVSAARVELMEFSDVEVRREWQHVDLLVISHDKRDRLVLLIENKLMSSEHSNQLTRYIVNAKAEFPDYPILPVYLTLRGDDPSESAMEAGYIPWSHVQLLHTLESIVQQRRAQLTPDVAAFVNDYLSVLRGVTMQDEKLVDLCKRIYRKHHEAIDLIMKHGKVDIFTMVVSDELASRKEFVLIGNAPTTWFMPKSLVGVVPKSHPDAWGGSPTCVACWFWPDKGKNNVHLILEAAKIYDADLRLRFMSELRDAGFKLTKKAFERDAVYSRFRRLHHTADLDDEDSIRDAVKALLKKAQGDFKRLEQVCSSVFKASAAS